MINYRVDDSADEISWSSVKNVEHLDSDLTYEKYLNEINSTLGPECTLSLSLDYESMKLLLKQAKEYEIPFINSNELKAIFILKNENANIKRRLLIEEGYLDETKVAHIIDPSVYKWITYLLEKEMDIDYIKEERKKHLELFLQSLEFRDCLPSFLEKYKYSRSYFYDYDLKETKLDKYKGTKLFLLDLVSEYFFDDYYINVKIDIEQIIKYCELIDTELIPRERLEFYRLFMSLESEKDENILEFFNQNKNKNLIEIFYDDIRMLKDESYKSLVNSCTVFTKDSPLYNKELSDKHGCEIYYLDGEEFFAFARSDIEIEKYRVDYSGDTPKLIEPQPTKEQIARLGESFTYIGKDDIQTYKHPNAYLTMLYRGIDYRTIGHVFHNDSNSSNGYYYISDCPNELHTPESLLRRSTKYPEIIIKDLNGIEPFALICFDKPTNWDIEFSKRNNMPIVIINSKKYNRKYEFESVLKKQYRRG